MYGKSTGIFEAEKYGKKCKSNEFFNTARDLQ